MKKIGSRVTVEIPLRRCWTFNNDLFHAGVFVAYGDPGMFLKITQKHLPRYYEANTEYAIDHFKSNPSAKGHCITSRLDNRTGIFILNKAPVGGAGITYTLVHECVHAAADYLSAVGIHFSEDDKNSELLAYLTEWFYEECWKRLSQIHPKVKTRPKRGK